MNYKISEKETIKNDTRMISKNKVSDYKTKFVIAYSLFGNDAIYLDGAIKNAQQALVLYPAWQARFYVDDTVPQDTITILKTYNAEIIVKPTSNGNSGMFWRFEPLFEPNTTMISRDVDSRLSVRERDAVNMWLASTASFHIMRDHKFHTSKILGGMFGAKPNPNILRKKAIFSHFYNGDKYGADQFFLSRIIYPLIKDDVVIHSSGVRYDSEQIISFPSKNEDFSYVGMAWRGQEPLTAFIDEEHIQVHTTKREFYQILKYQLVALFW